MGHEPLELCERLAECIVKRDFNGAHALLAPWLRNTLSPSKIQNMVDAASEELTYPPRSWSIDEGLAELEDLRKPDGYWAAFSKHLGRDNSQEFPWLAQHSVRAGTGCS